MRDRPARVEDVHETAAAMPHVEVEHGSSGNAIYSVGGKSFVFFRTPRADAIDPVTTERYDDVIVFWVDGEQDKTALLGSGDPYFTTPHFRGHPSVLVRATQVHRLSRSAVVALVQDAWLARASPARARAWLRDHGPL